MSITIMAQVWREKATSGSERLILLALADIANDDGTCWPSMQTLADKCNLSRRYVIDMIQSLRERGYLTRQKRVGDSGKLTSNLYRILTTNLVVNPASLPDSEPCLTNLVNPASLPGEVGLTNLVRQGSQNTSLNPSLNTSLNPPDGEDEFFRQVMIETRLMATANDLPSMSAWYQNGTIIADVKAALLWRVDNGKKPVKTISQLAGGVDVSRQRRVQGFTNKPTQTTVDGVTVILARD